MAKAQAENIDNDLLNRAALEIYMRTVGRGFRDEYIARQSFARAMAFCREAGRIADGGAVDVLHASITAPRVKIHKWHPVNDQPLKDEITGKPLIDEQVGDLSAHCPNKPADHPMNQRFWKARLAAGLELDPVDHKRYALAAKREEANEHN